MTATLKKFSVLLDKHQKGRIAILLILTILGAMLEALGVSMMLPLVSAIMNPEIISTNKYAKMVCELLHISSFKSFLITCIATLIVVYVIKDAFLALQNYARIRFVTNNSLATRKKMLAAIIDKPYEYFLMAQSGDILRAMQQDVGQAFALLASLLELAAELIVSLVLLITVLLIDPLMTLLVAVFLFGLLFLIIRFIRPIMTRAGINLKESSTAAYAWLIQAVTGIKEIKVSQREQFFKENYANAGERSTKSDQINGLVGAIPRLLIECVTVSSVLIVIVILILNGREASSLITSLSAFAMAAVKLLPSANRIINGFSAASYNQPALDKLLEDMKEYSEQKGLDEDAGEAPTASLPLDFTNTIELLDISYRYPNTSKYILKNASMEIPIGKSIGIVGPSGSGKTTSIDVLLGLLPLESGKILADGVDIFDDYSGWLGHIGYIPQTIFMLDDTIRGNVAFGVPREEVDDELVWEVLRDASLDEFVKSLPYGLDTEIGERGLRISGGQRQRIGIARALYTKPDVLILDEATSSLDNDTEKAIMDSVNSLHGRMTMIIIAHRLNTIEDCDIVYRVEKGKIVRER